MIISHAIYSDYELPQSFGYVVEQNIYRLEAHCIQYPHPMPHAAITLKPSTYTRL